MIPHTAPPFWPQTRLGSLAGAIYQNSAELRDSSAPEADRILSKCRVALLGIPDDTGVSLNHGRIGAKDGPHAFRAALAHYGTAAPMPFAAARPRLTPHSPLAAVPPYPHVFDAGDVIPGRDLDDTHTRVTQAAAALLERNLFPIAIGGGHDLTFPFVRATAARTPGMHAVYLDAHLDVRAEPGSGMPFRRLVEDCSLSRLTVIGLNPLVNSEAHFRWFAEHHGHVEIPSDPSTLSPDSIPDCLRIPTPAFLSIDLDAIDQSSAPGVSAMNPDGLSPRIAAHYAYAAGRAPHVRAFDIMELNPLHDERHRTARLAAHLFVTFLRGFAERAAQ